MEVTELAARILETKMVHDLVPFCAQKYLTFNPVVAAQSIANIVKSSLGPLGLDKMLVDNIGVCISSRVSYNRSVIYDTGSYDIK